MAGGPSTFRCNKGAEASTLAVVQAVTDNLGKMQKAVDPDIKVSFEFDQSPTVTLDHQSRHERCSARF